MRLHSAIIRDLHSQGVASANSSVLLGSTFSHFLLADPHPCAEDAGGRSRKDRLHSRLSVRSSLALGLRRGQGLWGSSGPRVSQALWSCQSSMRGAVLMGVLVPSLALGEAWRACVWAVPSAFAKACPEWLPAGNPCPIAAGNSPQTLGQFPSAAPSLPPFQAARLLRQPLLLSPNCP